MSPIYSSINMELEELKYILVEKLDKNLPSRIFLDNMCILDEESRNTPAYNDPKYIPFYYWLGTILEPKSFVEIGFRLGLFSAMFLRACKTVEKFFAFQEKTSEFYSPRIAKSNVYNYYKGFIDVFVGEIAEFKLSQIDLAIVNEETSYSKHREYLDVVWSKLNLDGFIFMDYVTRHKPAEEAYFDFCKSKNRNPTIVDTRYGVGIVKR